MVKADLVQVEAAGVSASCAWPDALGVAGAFLRVLDRGLVNLELWLTAVGNFEAFDDSSATRDKGATSAGQCDA